MPKQKPAQNQTQTGTLKKEEPKNQRAQVIRPEPLKTLLEWSAPIRPFKKRSREYFTTIGAIAFLLAVILLFLKEWLLIGVIVALVFVVYVMSTIEPQQVKHKITNRGVVSGGRKYSWDELGIFWISSKWKHKIINIVTIAHFQGVLQMLLGEANEEQVKKLLSEYLLFEEPEKTWTDRASQWLSDRIPLEEVD